MALAVVLHGCILALLVSPGMRAGSTHGVISVSLLPAGFLSGLSPGTGVAGTAGGTGDAEQVFRDLDMKRFLEKAIPVEEPAVSSSSEIVEQKAKPVSQDRPARPEIASRPAKMRAKAEKRTAVTARKPAPEPATQPATIPPSAVARTENSEGGPDQGAATNSTTLAGSGRGAASGAVPGGGGTGHGGAASGAGIGTGPVSAGFGTADGPRFVHRVLPQYPELARRRGREGRIVLRLVIGSGGELKDVAVVEGVGHGFEEAALAAVRASEYAPAVRGGRAVECSALLPIRFSLRGS